MLGPFIEYCIEKIFLEKFGPKPTVVYNIGRGQSRLLNVKGTVIQNEKGLINDCLHVLKVS